MSKNQINFTKMNADAMSQMLSFKSAAFQLATEELRYKSERKNLDNKLSLILANRKNDLDNGVSEETVAERFPRIEVDCAIRKAAEEHENIRKPLTEMMKSTYVLIPDNMYDAYIRKIEEGKRGDFLEAIKVFLSNLGIEELGQGQLSKFAESMSDRFGAKYATSKMIVKDNVFTSGMKKGQFNKLFMAVFCDMYIKENSIRDSVVA